MKRQAPGYYTTAVDAREIEVIRVRMDDGEYWIVLVDGNGGNDLYATKREAIAAIPAYVADAALYR